jgi:hypothetical protein
MTVLFSDDFNRADNPVDTGNSNWDRNASTWNVSSNELQHAETSFNLAPLETTTSAHAAVADCKASIVARTGAGFNGGPVARKQSGVNTYYTVRVQEPNSTLTIMRLVSDADTDLLIVGSYTHTIGDKITLEVSGTGATVTLRAYRNDVQVGSTYSDTDGDRITSAGQAGAKDWDFSASNLYDDFLVEDLAGGGGPTIPIVMHHRRMMAG